MLHEYMISSELVVAIELGSQGAYLNFRKNDGKVYSVVTFPSRGDGFEQQHWAAVDWCEVRRLLSHYNDSTVSLHGIRLSVDDAVRMLKDYFEGEQPEESGTNIRLHQESSQQSCVA